MSTPDVRVRLTPEGIKEVIFALRQIEAESKKSRAAAGEGLGVIKNSLIELKALLPTIGLAAAVTGFIALSDQALETAQKTGNLQKAVGGTVEQISALTLAFRTNESNQEGLQTVLKKTAEFMGKVRAGSADAKDAIASIGLDPSIASESTPRAFEAIAKQLAAIADPGKRAALALEIFGKNAVELLPAIIAVGTEGIDPFIEKARALGVLVDGSLVEASKRAHDALGLIKIQAEGLALQFTAGLAPAVSDAMESFSKSVAGDGINGMRKFGEFVGKVIVGITVGFQSLGKSIAAFAAEQVTAWSHASEAAGKFLTGNLKGAREAWAAGNRELAAIANALHEDQAQLQKTLDSAGQEAPRTRSTGHRRVPLPTIDPVDVAELRKQLAARLAMRQQALQDELKLQQTSLNAQDAANKEQYDASLISLQQYYDKRHDIAVAANTVELTTLKAQRSLLVRQLNTDRSAGGPENDEAKIKLRQQIAQLDGQIQQAQIEGGAKLAALDADRAKAVKDLQQQLDQSNAKLLDLEGNRHAVFEANLAEEIKSLTELGIRAGQTAEQIDSQVARLINARTNSFNFEEASRTATQKLDSFNRDADQIRRDQAAGVISQIEGEQRLIDIEAKRLPLLQQLAVQLQAAAEATGSDDMKQKAAEFAASVDQIASSYRQASDTFLQFRNAGIESLDQGIENLLMNMDKVKSIGDAFKQLALDVVNSLRKIAAEIVAKQATLAIVNALGGGTGGSFASLFGGYRGGQIRGYAGGGDIRGPRLPVAGPDKIPFMGQEGEFVLRKSRVQEPGALSFLRAWNEGRLSLAQARRMPRFASGGVLGAGLSKAEIAAVGGRGAGAMNFNFNLAPDSNGKLSRLTMTQIRASVAQGLAEANRRNN